MTDNDPSVFVVAETTAEMFGIRIVGWRDNREAAEALAENQRDPEMHGQEIVVRSPNVIKSVTEPNPDCENETCEGDHRDETHNCDWHGNELTLCEPCIDYHSGAVEVLDDD